MAEGMEQFIKHPTLRQSELAVEVEINNDALSVDDTVGCVEIGDVGLFHADVFWSPRINGLGAAIYPSSGDRGLLIVSDQGNSWLIDWTPNA